MNKCFLLGIVQITSPPFPPLSGNLNLFFGRQKQSFTRMTENRPREPVLCCIEFQGRFPLRHPGHSLDSFTAKTEDEKKVWLREIQRKIDRRSCCHSRLATGTFKVGSP